jgi:hypothetical protein
MAFTATVPEVVCGGPAVARVPEPLTLIVVPGTAATGVLTAVIWLPVGAQLAAEAPDGDRATGRFTTTLPPPGTVTPVQVM